ncbi:hypothetical protein RUND412_000284 [Rhizina undulata]
MDSDPYLKHCWPLNSCSSCVRSTFPMPCGWCPSSQSCVPAPNGLLSVTNPNICPLRSDRFELRTGTLGCGVSAATAFTAIFSVLITLAVVAAIYAIIKYRDDMQEWLSGLRDQWGGVVGAMGEREVLMDPSGAVVGYGGVENEDEEEGL